MNARKLSILWGALTALLLTATSTPCYAARLLPGDYMNEYTVGRYVTPHIAWAKPWAQGKLKVFFVTPFTGAAREVSEVWQRADIEVYGETTAATMDLGRTQGCFSDVQDTSPDEKATRLVRKLSAQSYDVFVIGNFKWSALPLEVQYLLLKQVSDGAGLVIVYPREVRPEVFKNPEASDREWVLSSVPLQAMTFFSQRMVQAAKLAGPEAVGDRLLRTYRLGKGRLAVLDYGLDAPFQPCTGGMGLTPLEDFDYEKPTCYEYYLSLVVRTILWAGRKPARVRLTSLANAPMRAQAGQSTEMRVVLQGQAEAGEGFKLRWQVKNRWGEEEGGGERALQYGATPAPVNIKLPPLGGGLHYVDLLLDSSRGREDFGTQAVRISGPATILELEPQEQQTPPFAVGVRGRLQPAGASLRLELRDNYGRLFYIAQGASAHGATADGTFAWSVPPEALKRAVSSCLRVRAAALVGRTVADEREVTLTIPHAISEEYPACMWGLSPGYIGHLAAQRLRELGFNMVLGGRDAANARRLAREDLKNIPYCTRIHDRTQLVKQDSIVGIRQEMTKLGRSLARFGPYVYSLGDENAMPGDLGYQPEDKPWLLEFLKRRHSSLDDLNRAWGTEFKDWDSVQPLPLGEAKDGRQYAAWHDVLSFREDLYARRHHEYADAIRAGDPGARVGAEGSEEGDLELTITGHPPSKPLQFWGPYRDARYNALLRSVASRDLVRGNWFGGYRSGRHSPKTCPALLWDALFDGNNLIQCFALASVETIFNTDYSLSYWNLWYWDDLAMLLDGPGQLVQRASYEYDPVAVLHSQASVHASEMEAPPGRYHESHAALLAALGERWLQQCYVTDRHPEALDARRVKLLFLPCARALSGEVCEALRRYVAAGGVLVADVRPAVLAGNCAPLDHSQLADLFGARIGPEPKATSPAPLALRGEYRWAGGVLRLAGPTIPKVVADASVELAGGEALGKVGETPAVICQRQGRGLAVLLNFALDGLGTKRGSPSVGTLSHLIRALADAAHVVPQAEVIGADGKPVSDCRLARFRYGSAVIHGILLGQGHDQPQACVLRLARAAHLYETRTGEYLGKSASLRLQLVPAHGRLVCALPEKLAAVHLVMPASAQAGRAAKVGLRLRGGGGKGPHLVRVHVIGPEGKLRRHYSRTLAVDGQSAEILIPFAFNDDRGTWTVEAREVATGTRARATLRLSPSS